MTYARFHWIFNVPLLVVLFLAGWGGAWAIGTFDALVWVIIAAVAFTTVWDNLAVRWGIWGFPRDKYTLRLGWLPIEEYVFFVLQTLLVIVAIHFAFHWRPMWHRTANTQPDNWTWICLAGSIPAFVVIGLGIRDWMRKTGPRFNYAVHLLWFLPVIYAQWFFGMTLYYEHLGLIGIITGAFGVYYTIADYIAVRCGLWFFDEKQITGWKFAGVLPWEEIAFFFLTSLLVAQSYLLLLPYYQR